MTRITQTRSALTLALLATIAMGSAQAQTAAQSGVAKSQTQATAQAASAAWRRGCTDSPLFKKGGRGGF